MLSAPRPAGPHGESLSERRQLQRKPLHLQKPLRRRRRRIRRRLTRHLRRQHRRAKQRSSGIRRAARRRVCQTCRGGLSRARTARGQYRVRRRGHKLQAPSHAAATKPYTCRPEQERGGLGEARPVMGLLAWCAPEPRNRMQEQGDPNPAQLVF